jgi:hypothetical protein
MADANTFEFWLDVAVDGHAACTIFGRIEMPVPPWLASASRFIKQRAPLWNLRQGQTTAMTHPPSLVVHLESPYSGYEAGAAPARDAMLMGLG